MKRVTLAVPSPSCFDAKGEYHKPMTYTPKQKQSSMDTMRISSYLARSGLGSRKTCEVFIADSRITVNSCTITDPDYRVADGDVVCLDGRPAKPLETLYYYLLNKPKGYVCSHTSRFDEKLAVNLIESPAPHLFSAGRLDKQSEGLIVFTNDGGLTHRIEHPDYGLVKTYHVVVHGPRLTDDMLTAMEKGMLDKGELLKPLSVTHIGDAEYGRQILEFRLDEGKNREVRRLCRLSNLRVRKLLRTAIGPLSLDGLAPGEYRVMTDEEVEGLKKG